VIWSVDSEQEGQAMEKIIARQYHREHSKWTRIWLSEHNPHILMEIEFFELVQTVPLS
jgi:hypothetical protein